MSRSSEGPSALKRKRQDNGSQSDSLTEHERRIYDVIRNTKTMGINKQAIKLETNLTMVLINKTLKTLEGKKKINQVKGIQSKALYMAEGYEPSNEITGGAWYENGDLDTVFVDVVKGLCLEFINKHEVASLKEILAEIERSRIYNGKLAPKDLKQLLEALVLENEVMKAGEDSYKCCKKKTRGDVPKLASIPCGVCPRIKQCTPDGIISPATCEYFNKWLDF